MSKGLEGVIMKAWRADDFKFTVTSVEPVTDKYIRVGFTAGGLFAAHPSHPTQWVRLWIDDDDGKTRQRGYTLVDSDPGNDSFVIEFAVHYGPASRWAENAAVGDVLEASVMPKGSGASTFSLPDPAPSDFVVFGDTASLPAINSLLDAIGDIPARVWLEWQYDSDKTLPVHGTDVTWLERVDEGRLLREQAESIAVAPTAFAWVACDGKTTRSIVKTLRASLPKESIKSQAYWK